MSNCHENISVNNNLLISFGIILQNFPFQPNMYIIMDNINYLYNVTLTQSIKPEKINEIFI